MGKRHYIKLIYAALLLSFLIGFSTGCGGKGVYYVGHEGMKVYHRPGCEYAPPKNSSVVFMSTTKARKAGYRACKVCDPLGKVGKK